MNELNSSNYREKNLHDFIQHKKRKIRRLYIDIHHNIYFFIFDVILKEELTYPNQEGLDFTEYYMFRPCAERVRCFLRFTLRDWPIIKQLFFILTTLMIIVIPSLTISNHINNVRKLNCKICSDSQNTFDIPDSADRIGMLLLDTWDTLPLAEESINYLYIEKSKLQKQKLKKNVCKDCYKDIVSQKAIDLAFLNYVTNEIVFICFNDSVLTIEDYEISISWYNKNKNVRIAAIKKD